MDFNFYQNYRQRYTVIPITTVRGPFHLRERKKITNKGTDQQYVAIFVTQYNSSLSSFVPNFGILTKVVAEKSLTEKKAYRQTNKHNYSKNYIPPIYFVPGV